jgi:hypothetical protein
MLSNKPPRADRWRGPDFDATITGAISCPTCNMRLRASGVTRYDGVTTLTCQACHTIALEIEQHRASAIHAEMVP